MLSFVNHQNDDFLRFVRKCRKCMGQVDIPAQTNLVQTETHSSNSDFVHAGTLCQAGDKPFTAPDSLPYGIDDDQAWILGQIHYRGVRFYSTQGAWEVIYWRL